MAGVAVIGARVVTTHDAEDEADGSNKLDELDMAGRDQGGLDTVDVCDEAAQEAEGAELEREDGDGEEDEDADVEGCVLWVGDGAQLQAGLDETGQGEREQKPPAGRTAEAVSDCKGYGDDQGRDVKDNFGDGNGISL